VMACCGGRETPADLLCFDFLGMSSSLDFGIQNHTVSPNLQNYL